MVGKRFAGAVLALAWCGVARANDKPAIAPPPAWVTPLGLPAEDGQPGGSAVSILVNDQQAQLAPDGVTTYSEIAYRIETPQGLAAGSVSVPWNPDLDTFTVHKLHIIRAGRVIDVLATQSFTVIRRETNLERATLDGRLTATIQPDGLQVGDVIDFAASIRHHDPALGRHVEALFAFGAEARTAAARLTAHWPDGLAVRWQARPGLPAVAEHAGPGGREAGFAVQPLAPLTLPKGAPLRYATVRQAEFTDLRDWAAAAAILEPAFTKASALAPGGALAAEAARIAAASRDPKARATAALALVQDQVRYVAILLADGGLVPVAADVSWARRYGDCKGKTVLLLGLLHALGVDATPVLVSARGGDGLDRRLPMLGLFDHVLVRATIAGRTYWLDGTRQGDRDLDAIETPAFHWGLPLLPAGATLVPIMPEPPTRPFQVTAVRLDARAGLGKPAPAHVETRFRGDPATAVRLAIEALPAEKRDAELRQYWRNEYAFITPDAVKATFDAATGEETLTLDGTATLDWSGGGYETDGTAIGYTADFTREPGLDRDAPFAVAFPTFTRTTETILLPDNGRGFSLDDAAFDRTIAGVAYHRAGELKGGTVTLERTVRSVATEFPASEAAAAQATLTALGRKAVYVRPPAAGTPAPAPTPTQTPANGLETVDALVRAGHGDEALAAFNKTPAAYRDTAAFHGARGGVLAALGRQAEARAELDRAVALAPRDPGFLDLRGQLALADGDRDQALSDAAMVIALAPDRGEGYWLRARVYAQGGSNERARADAEQAIAHGSANPDVYLLLANALRNLGREDDSLAVAGRLVAAASASDYAHVVAGAIYGRFHRDADARREFDRAIAIQPSAAAYLTRLEYRPADDLAGRQADIDAARRLEPDNIAVAEQQAKLDDRAGRYPQAITAWTALLARRPEGASVLVARGVDYARTGQPRLADADFAAARAMRKGPAMLNELCWAKATANVALASALSDCDEAIALSPDYAPVLDSRAFVLTRMGRWDEAVAAYDRALAISPASAASMFGRAVAHAGRGDAAAAAADRAAAVKHDPEVEREFAGYGVTLKR